MPDPAAPAPSRDPHDRFIPGYLDDLSRAGKRPTTGYPATRLPDAGERTMLVTTSYVGARKPDRP